MRLYFLTKKSLKASSHDSKLGFEEGSYSMTLLVTVVVCSCSRAATAGNWQGPQGLGLALILQNRNRRRQWWHADDVAATVAALPAKNWPWWP